MSLFDLATDEGTTAFQRSNESRSSRNGNGDGNGHSKSWLWNRGSQPVVAEPQTSRPVIFPAKKIFCPPPGRSVNGDEAIARQDAADMARLCDGDAAAMTRLMRRHAQRLQIVIARVLKDWAEAADVVEEAFIRVHRHCHRFDLQARFSTWLYTIALNLARNRLRHRARQPEFVPLDELTEEQLESQQRVPLREPEPDVHLEREEELHGVEDAIADLPPLLREAVRLFAYEGLSQIEIGVALHCSPKAVESRLYHARIQLRADYERFLQPPIQTLSVSPFKPQHKIEIKT